MRQNSAQKIWAKILPACVFLLRRTEMSGINPLPLKAPTQAKTLAQTQDSLSPMSEAQLKDRTRNRTHEGDRAHKPAPAAPAAPAPASEAVASLPPATVTIEIAGLNVTLPRKFAAGHVLTATQANILDAAYQRQFTNNQNALAKARAAATPPKPALSASDLAALYADYEPSVGGAPRQSAVEKTWHEAAWLVWTALVTAHNETVRSGGTPVIAKAAGKIVTLQTPPRKSDIKASNAADLAAGKVERVYSEEELAAAHKEALDSFATAKDAFCERLRANPEYAPAVQARFDALMAERGAKKPEPVSKAEATVSADDLI